MSHKTYIIDFLRARTHNVKHLGYKLNGEREGDEKVGLGKFERTQNLVKSKDTRKEERNIARTVRSQTRRACFGSKPNWWTGVWFRKLKALLRMLEGSSKASVKPRLGATCTQK